MRPTGDQRRDIALAGLDPDDWLVIGESLDKLRLVRRDDGRSGTVRRKKQSPSAGGWRG